MSYLCKMTDDEKIDFLKDLRADLGSPMPPEAPAKSIRREIRDFFAGIFLILGVVLQICCGYLSYRLGVSWWLIAGIIAFILLTLTGNRIVRFSTVTSGEAGFATGATYLLFPYFVNITVLLAFLALLMGEWVLCGYFAFPALAFWRIERFQTATAEPGEACNAEKPPGVERSS